MLRYSPEFKEKISKEYLSGEGSTCYLGGKYGINARTVWDWVMKYKEQGIVGFISLPGFKSYSSESK